MDSFAIASKSIRFWTYFIPFIPAIFCSIFVLYHFLFDRALRNALHNHVFIIIITLCLISQVTVYPWMLYNYHITGIWQRSPAFCTIWLFIDFCVFCLQSILFAWASFERHILIFHDRWLRRRIPRFFLHYLSIVAMLVYFITIYSIYFFFPPCANTYYDSYTYDCMWPCLWRIQQYALYEIFAHQAIPIFLIAIFSFLLFIRVVWMKTRMRQGNNWRRNAKMAIQLFSIVSVYLTFILPYVIGLMIRWFLVRTDLTRSINFVLQYLSYFPVLLNPFICLLSSNELRARLIHFLKHGKLNLNTIFPATLNVNTQPAP